MTNTVHYRHLWKHSPPFRNFSTKISVQNFQYKNYFSTIFVLNCTGTRRLHAIRVSGGPHNLLSPGKRESEPSSQQSWQGQSHGSTGTSIATKLRLRWIKRSSFLWGARHRSGFSKVLFSLLLSKVTKDATLSGGRGFAGQCGGVWWDGTVSSSSPFTHTAQGREGTRHRCCFFTKLKPKGDIGWTENLEQEGESDVNFANQSLLALELSVTEKALGLRPKNR